MEDRTNFFSFVLKNFNSFQSQFLNEIKSEKTTENNKKEICLVENTFFKEIFNEENYYRADNVYFYSDIKPQIIDNLYNEIKGRFQIVRKDLLELLYGDYKSAHDELIRNYYYNYYYLNIVNIINKAEYFSYIAGNNKLIIISEKYNSAFLILNPIDAFINEKNFVLAIILKNLKDTNINFKLYNELISNDLSINNINLKENIILNDTDENYNQNKDIRKILDNIKNYKRKIYLKYNKIFVFVNLYYFEKILKHKDKEKVFKEHQDYYIINNDWLNKYKSFNHYEKICEKLNEYEEKNKFNNFDYYNLDNYKYAFYNDVVNGDTFDLPDNFNIDINELQHKEENFNNGFIIHEKIIKLIYDIANSKSIILSPKKIKVKECLIYIIDKLKNVNIGIMNENLLFNTQYEINYKTKAIYAQESEYLFNNPIKCYIKMRKGIISNQKNKKVYLYLNEKQILGTVLYLVDQEKEIESTIKENLNQSKKNQSYKPDFEKQKIEIKNNEFETKENKVKK